MGPPARHASVACALAAVLAGAVLAGCGGSSAPKVNTTSVPAKPPGQFGRNVARITGLSPTDVAAAAILALHPPKRHRPPNGWILFPDTNWRYAAMAAQFASHPIDAALLPIKSQFVPTPGQDVLRRLGAGALPRAKGLQVIVLGSVGDSVVSTLKDGKFKVAELKAPTPAQLALQLVPYKGGFAKSHSTAVMVVSQTARDFALPAAAWSAYSGDTIAWVDRDRIPAATSTLLAQRRKLLNDRPSTYVIGPPSVVSARVLSGLRRYGPVKRIGGPTPAAVALALARYRDRATGFGWNLNRGPASLSFVNPRDWAYSYGAFNFAGSGPQAPLLFTNGALPLPLPLATYLEQLHSARANQGFVFGPRRSVSTALVHELDRLLGRGG